MLVVVAGFYRSFKGGIVAIRTGANEYFSAEAATAGEPHTAISERSRRVNGRRKGIKDCGVDRYGVDERALCFGEGGVRVAAAGIGGGVGIESASHHVLGVEKGDGAGGGNSDGSAFQIEDTDLYVALLDADGVGLDEWHGFETFPVCEAVDEAGGVMRAQRMRRTDANGSDGAGR